MFNNNKIKQLGIEIAIRTGNFNEQIKRLSKLIDTIHLRNVTAKDEIDILHERIKKLESTKKPKAKS